MAWSSEDELRDRCNVGIRTHSMIQPRIGPCDPQTSQPFAYRECREEIVKATKGIKFADSCAFRSPT